MRSELGMTLSTATTLYGDPFAPGLLRRLPGPPRKVALLRASRIGDFLCAVPAFRALRAALPEAEIAIITLPLLCELALRSPYLDRVIPFPGFPGIAEQFFDARRCLGFLQAVQAERFDLAIQMQGSGVHSNPFTLLLGARATAGFVRAGEGAGRLDAALPYPERGHEVSRPLALAAFLGAPARGTATEFPLWPADHAAAETLLREAAPPLIGLHPSARDAARRWPPERFAATGAALLRRHGGTLVLLGDAEAHATARALRAALPADLARRCRDLTGATTLPVLGAVIARLAALVTNDSGPAHIAYALGAPTITIFGGSNPEAYGPPHAGPFRVVLRDVPCRPAGSLPCASCAYDHRCLTGVAVADVLAAAEEVIGSAGTYNGTPPGTPLDLTNPHREGACHASAR
jgi:ADP-heptose:LPS heptosyltransferase